MIKMMNMAINTSREILTNEEYNEINRDLLLKYHNATDERSKDIIMNMTMLFGEKKDLIKR